MHAVVVSFYYLTADAKLRTNIQKRILLDRYQLIPVVNKVGDIKIFVVYHLHYPDLI